MFNSIAIMKKQMPTPTKESLALKAAFERSKMSQAGLAKHLNVSAGLVWQWLNGRRPVPAANARKLGDLLQINPDKISADYAEIAQQDGSGNVFSIRKGDSGAEVRPDLAQRRLENDIDAMRFALAAMTTVMVGHRPAEATAFAKRLRGSVPARFLERGFLYELLSALDGAPKE
jgi:transcriptional regulator with XRE-family HTH domain